MPPLKLQTLYGEQIAAISDAVILLLMADTKGVTYTHLTYSLRSESVLMLLVLAGSQLTQPLGGSGVLDPLIDNLMQRPTREASALMTALLTHYTDMAAEPSVPRVPTAELKWISAIASAAARAAVCHRRQIGAARERKPRSASCAKMCPMMSADVSAAAMAPEACILATCFGEF